MGFINSLLGGNSSFNAQGTTQQQYQDYLAQADQGTAQQQQFVNALAPAGQQGLGAQQQLLTMLQSQAQGGGPNPALDQLNNTTGQNIANQGALQASQRGVGQNAGMLARQVAQQGGNIQQQAVGQAALQRAQQTLAAQQLLGQQANQQVGQQAQGLGQLQASQQGLTGQVGGMLGQQNSTNAGTASSNAQSNASFLPNVGTAVAGAAKMFSKGGAVSSGPRSAVAQYLCMGGDAYKSGGRVAGKAMVAGDSPKNDNVPAMLSPGEIVVPRSHAQDPDKAAAFAKAVAMKMRKK